MMVCLAFSSAIAISAGRDIAAFMNAPSLLLTVGVTFFLLLGTYGTTFLRFVPDAALTFFTVRDAPNLLFADIAKTGSRYILGCGVLGTLIGFVQMLHTLDDPSQVGGGMALSLLTILYAVLSSELGFAFLYKVYSRPADADNTPNDSLPLTGVGISCFVVVTLIGALLCILIVFSSDGLTSDTADQVDSPRGHVQTDVNT